MTNPKPRPALRLALAAALAVAGVGAGGWAWWSSAASTREVRRPTGARQERAERSSPASPQRVEMQRDGEPGSVPAPQHHSLEPTSYQFPDVATADDVGPMMKNIADRVFVQASKDGPEDARRAASHTGLADAVQVFLEPAVAGDALAFEEAVRKLRGEPPEAPEGRPLGPASSLLTLASLDYSNLALRVPGPDDAPMFGKPKDRPAGERPRLPVAMLRKADVPPEGGAPVETASLVIPLFEIFPGVADFKKRGMDAVTVTVPGRVKGSTGTPDFDLNLVMVWNDSLSRWQPGLLALDTRNMDLFKEAMAEARARRAVEEKK